MVNKLLTSREIIWALEKTGGNVAAAGRKLGCSDSTVRRYIKEDFDLQLEIERIKEDEALTSDVNNKFTPVQMATAIIYARGNLSVAARRLKTSRVTVHAYINKFKEVKEAYFQSNDIFVDDLENALYENAIVHKKEASIIYGLKTKGKHRGWTEKIEVETHEEAPLVITLPADSIAGSFFEPYRVIKSGEKPEIILKGGRGSTKSSFVSLILIELLVNNPMFHAMATRQVANTLRDSVHSQIEWAIEYLGISHKFKSTKSPLEIAYLPTGQKIYFRGADDPLKIKSIKPKFGHIGILWFEELDQFKGSAAVRSIVQSAVRGGDNAVIIKSYNPPRSKSNWVNKDLEVPKKNRYVHDSNYLDVPKSWLGKVFLDEAEHLKKINPSAYDHEYMGMAVGTGGLIFENLDIRKITNKEISQFERPLHGLDWGYFPDPAEYGACYFDAPRLILYIYSEVRKWKHGNRAFYNAIKKEGGYKNSNLLTCDSAEPKSIADFRKFGATARGAEKGPESVTYSMKWLQSLVKIVIDPERCPYATEEFLNYEHEINKEGEYISGYPDKNNHSIDRVRYATNRIWKQRGK